MEKMNDVFGLLLFLFHLPLFIKSQSPTFWNAAAKEELKTALNIERIERRSKNVAFFLGDGMGISTLTPSRILRGEITNGEMNSLSFEKFAHVGLVKTYNTDQLVPDSAGTATAFCSGVKTKAGIIGIDDRAVRGNCSTARPEYYQKSFIKMAQEQGKSIGLVTTTRITHATPAATYAHVVDRNWEADSSMRKVPTNLRNQCPDIATQLLSNGIDYQVILGGGRKAFMMKNQSDPSNSTLKGLRDDEDLIQKWNAMQKAKNRRYRYITTGSELRTMKNSDVDYLFGLFSYSHMDYELERRQNGQEQPSLKEMVDKALEILKRNEKGFVLFVEGGRIDLAHHDNQGKLALYDTLALDDAVASVAKSVNINETLMIVTADHSHVFTYGGYHKKGTPLFGKLSWKAKDGKPFTSLLYANGPSAPMNTVRQNITGVNTQAITYKQQAAVPLKWETHGGEDVGVYAVGPMAHLIHGVHEQSYLAHVVMYSAGLGDYQNLTDSLVSVSCRFAPKSLLVFYLSVLAFVLNRVLCL